MLENVRNTLKTHWERFYISIFDIGPTLNTEQIRKLAWARYITSYEAVPDNL